MPPARLAPSELKRRRLIRDRQRKACTFYLGDASEQWRQMCAEKNVDSEVLAVALMDVYREHKECWKSTFPGEISRFVQNTDWQCSRGMNTEINFGHEIKVESENESTSAMNAESSLAHHVAAASDEGPLLEEASEGGTQGDRIIWSRVKSRRKQSLSQIARRCEDEDDQSNPGPEETISENDHGTSETEDQKMENSQDDEESDVNVDYISDQESQVEDTDGSKDEEEEDDEQDKEWLTEADMAKILKESDSEPELKPKKKEDSDSDWMPSDDGAKRSKRVPSQEKYGKGSTSEGESDSESSDEGEEEGFELRESRSSRRKTDKQSDDGIKPAVLHKPKLLPKGTMQSCSVCDATFTDPTEAKEHLQVHYVIECNLCPDKFYSPNSLREHKRTKHPTVHRCNLCSFSGRTKSTLIWHQKKKHPQEMKAPRITLCYVCGEQFSFPVNVRKHLAQVHQIVEKSLETYICDQCGLEYYRKHSFRKHLLSHREKSIFCEFEGCESKFSNDGQYKRHYDVVHLKIKRHSCPYENCEMKFAFKKTLMNHVNMVHLKLRLFPCTWPGCERSFYAKKHLTVHLRIHNDEKPFECTECDYRCRQRAALNWHLKKHGIVPQHPESLENEMKKQKDGFPVNFKRGRKRTRFKKSRGKVPTSEEIAARNRKKNVMPGADASSDPANEDQPSVKNKKASKKEAIPEEKQSPSGVNQTAMKLENEESAMECGQTEQPVVEQDSRGFGATLLAHPAQENYLPEILKRDVEYSIIGTSRPVASDFSEKDLLQESNFLPVDQTCQSDYTTERLQEFQVAQEADFEAPRDGPCQNERGSAFVTNHESGFQPGREAPYQNSRDTSVGYQGFTMKENMMDSSRPSMFPRFIGKEVFLSGAHQEGICTRSQVLAQGMSDVDYSRLAPKNELSALRTLPGFQGQMEIPEYSSQSSVQSVMGPNPASYNQMYNREYK